MQKDNVFHESSSLNLSRFGIGNWLSDKNIEEKYWDSAIGKCLDYGINWFDTADSYNNGLAETQLSTSLRKYSRGSYFISTKLFFPVQKETLFDSSLSKKKIVDSVNASLYRTKLEYLDLVYLHRFCPKTDPLEILKGIDLLIKQGKILYWGVSRWPIEALDHIMKLCDDLGIQKPTFYQDVFNLFQNESTVNNINKLKMSFIGYSILSRGVLTGKYLDEKELNSIDNRLGKYPGYIYDLDESKSNAMVQLKSLANQLDVSITHLVLQYYMASEIDVKGYLFGFSNLKQLENNLSFLSESISTDIEWKLEIKKIFKIWNV